ncbi:MAG: hypothetical protein ABJN26_00165 [Stappiaceae bacterium]
MVEFRFFLTAFAVMASFALSASASGVCGLKMIGQNGAELCLNKLTVVDYSVENEFTGLELSNGAKPPYLVRVTLSKAAAREFGSLTQANVEKELHFYLNDKNFYSPYILEPMLGGLVLFSVDTEEELELIIAEMRSDNA